MTSSLFWSSALVVALIDIVIVAVLLRRVADHEFRRLGIALPVASMMYWTLLWTVVILFFWKDFYSYVFPVWLRTFPPVLGIAYGAVGFVLWYLATRLPGNSVAGYCLLGGVEGLVTHVWAVYGLGALTEPPMMEGVSAASVLTFAFFEKVLYWSLVLVMAAVAQHIGRRSAKAS